MVTWFPIRTSSGAFRHMHSSSKTKLEHALAGYDYYIPWEHYEFRHHRSKKLLRSKKPLIPGYVFIADITDFERLERIPEIYGPIRGMDNRPRTIRETEIDRLKEAEQMITEAFAIMTRNREMTKNRVAAMYPSGSAIRIGQGHIMSGREARVLEATGRKTLKAVIEGMFGTDVEIEIPIELVEAAE
jgi:transcription antitermination factor NusG